MAHKWTEFDEEVLEHAIEKCLPMRDSMPSADAWWACVVGAAGFEDVTPDAANKRWYLIRQRRQQEIATADQRDAWEQVAQQVEEYERTVAEATLDTTTDISVMVQRIAKDVERLQAATTSMAADLNALRREWEGAPNAG